MTSPGASPSRLEAALRATFSSTMTPQQQIWFDYALSANERGRTCVEQLRQFFPTLEGKRVLDIGAGYGGVCISAAQAGAICVGVENDAHTLAFARKNLEDFPGLPVTLLPRDIFTSMDQGELGRFDLIICDNVIEHVVFPERLILALASLLAPEGLAYVTVPNAFSANQVLSDCHYGLFGITLLDPYDGATYLRQKMAVPEYGVTDYFGWDYYQGKFEKYGFGISTLHPAPSLSEMSAALEDRLQQLEARLVPLRADPDIPEGLRQKIEARIQQYVVIARADLAHAREIDDPRRRAEFEALLVRDYWTELWYVVLHRPAPGAEPRASRYAELPDQIILPRDPKLLARRLMRSLTFRARRMLGRLRIPR